MRDYPTILNGKYGYCRPFTISAPTDLIRKFKRKLKENNVDINRLFVDIMLDYIGESDDPKFKFAEKATDGGV
jgi:hypothetical protein